MIKRDLTTPYNPQQNGVAERKNRTIMEVARAMLHDCCNLTDHIGLPIIHINTDIHNKDKRQEQVSRITNYTILRGSIQYRELNRVLI